MGADSKRAHLSARYPAPRRLVAGRQASPTQDGVTLLELLVAISIMALSLALIYRVVGSSVRSAGDITFRSEAASVARSVLASRNSVLPEGWFEQGRNGVYAWNVQSAPWGAPAAGSTIVPLQHVQVTVNWSDGGRSMHLTLDTLLPQRQRLSHEVAQ